MSTPKFYGNLEFTFQCDAKASAFSKCESGQFCSQCQTPVYNLNQLTDEQITDLLVQHNGEICAEVNRTQLHGPGEFSGKRPQLLSWALAGITTLLVSTSAGAQEQVAEKVKTEQVMTDENGHAYCPAPNHIPEAKAPTTEAEQPIRFRRGLRLHRYVRTTYRFPFLVFGRPVKGRTRFRPKGYFRQVARYEKRQAKAAQAHSTP